MTRLYLMRHAKAEKGSGGKDFDRVLTERGRADARAAGVRLARMESAPEVVLFSPAARARESAEIAAAAAGGGWKLVPVQELYTATAEEYLAAAARPGVEAARMLVGHNPSMEQLAAHFERSGAGMGTAETAWFDFDIGSWEELGPESRPAAAGRLT